MGRADLWLHGADYRSACSRNGIPAARNCYPPKPQDVFFRCCCMPYSPASQNYRFPILHSTSPLQVLLSQKHSFANGFAEHNQMTAPAVFMFRMPHPKRFTANGNLENHALHLRNIEICQQVERSDNHSTLPFYRLFCFQKSFRSSIR